MPNKPKNSRRYGTHDSGPYIKAVLEQREYPQHGYIVKKELIDGTQFGMDDFTVDTAYTLHGDYIGDPKTAEMLCEKRGIRPERIDDSHKVCSVGFSEKDNKWYGWSHRAIYGYGIGDVPKTAYPDEKENVPGKPITTMDEARQAACDFAMSVSALIGD